MLFFELASLTKNYQHKIKLVSMDYTSKLSVNKYVGEAWLIICKTMRSYFTALFACKMCHKFTSAVGATRVNSKGLNSLYDYRYGIDLILIHSMN